MRATRILAATLWVVAVSLTRPTWSAVDPSADGPFSVVTMEYDLGATAFLPTGFPAAVEVVGKVHYPSNLSAGPFPLVVFVHGRHVTCHVGSSPSLQWPCPSGASPIPSYRGYDYIANKLATHGYIVVSIGANGINARDNEVNDLGMNARAQLIERHLRLFKEANDLGSSTFGTLFRRRIDLSRIGTMGHSRGGEGVVTHAVFNRTRSPRFNVKAVLPLAPTNFNRPLLAEIPVGVVLPYCDGDVADLQGVHYYDDARASAQAAQHSILIMGANHNFFNTIWTPGLFVAGAADDASGRWGPNELECGINSTPRLDAGEQRVAGSARIVSFFRAHLGDEIALLPYLKGDSDPAYVKHAYQAPPADRLDINRYDLETNEAINDLGGAVQRVSVSAYDVCGDDASERVCLSLGSALQPHTHTSARATSKLGLPQLRLTWFENAGGSHTNVIPAAHQDFRRYDYLSFRVSADHVTSGFRPFFLIELVDSQGRSQNVQATIFSDALSRPLDDASRAKVILTDIRVPLSLFTQIDRAAVRSVVLRLGNSFGSQHVGVLISDMALTRDFPDDLTNPAPLPVSVTFESALQWRNAGPVSWIRDSAGTPTGSTGPATGAAGSAFYAYVEADQAAQTGDRAMLESDVFDASDSEISFYYHMFGADIGILALDVLEDGQWQEVWSIRGQQHGSSAAAWTQRTVSLAAFAGNVKVRFRTVAVGGALGDIAIDGIEVRRTPSGGTLAPITSFSWPIFTTPQVGVQLSQNLDSDDRTIVSFSGAGASSTRFEYRIDFGTAGRSAGTPDQPWTHLATFGPGVSAGEILFDPPPITSSNVPTQRFNSTSRFYNPNDHAKLYYRIRTESGGNVSDWRYTQAVWVFFND